MNSSPVVQKTADGSFTLYLPELNETYHSIHGAKQESYHVFVKEGLLYLLAQGQRESYELNVFEVGFGTGLNALLFAEEASNLNQAIQYTGIEKFPLKEELLSQLQASTINVSLFEKVHQCDWEKFQTIHDHFQLRKIHADMLDYCFEDNNMYDLILMDAFAPDKQTEMWSIEIFEKLYAAMKPGAFLLTYSAKGDVKRAMRACGFIVKRIQGPPGKKHMLRAQKPIHETI